jgi:PKD repeat protein
MMRCTEGIKLGFLAGGKLLTAIVLLLCICLLLPCAEATGHIVWQKHLGGSKSDVAYSIIQTYGGYVVAGRADALIADDENVKGNRGYLDYWIVNLSSSGNLIWKKCLGGIWDETAYSIIRTDGGYIVVGSTHSKDGDASGIHPNKECKNDKCDSCPADFWVVKLKSSGKMEWQKCLGGTKDDVAYSINQTKDGGYIVAGSARSNDGDVNGLHGGKDFWVVKVVEGEINCTITAPDSLCPNSIGNVASTAESGAKYKWTIGNGTITSANNTQSITFTAGAYELVSLNVYVEKYGYWDKGYKDIPVALANCSWTSKSPVCNNSRVFFYGPAGMDSYQWDFGDGSKGSGRNANNTYSAPGNYKVRLNTTLRGCSKSCTGTVRVLSGPECNWTSPSPVCHGTPVQFTGPAMMDSCYREFGDGQNSTAKDPSLTASCWGSQRTCAGPIEVRQPARANRSCIEWQKCLGGSEDDEAKSVRRTADGGYIVAGYTKSNNGDVSGCHGKEDFWVVKLNATGNLTWQRCLGGSGDDRAQSVRQTADGGYVVAGYTYSNNGDVKGLHGESDYWVVKLDASGNLTWQRCLGGTSQDEAYDIQQTADGWYIVAGGTHSNDGDVKKENHGNWDFWIVRLDASGNLAWQWCLGGDESEKAYSIQQTADDEYIVAGGTYSDDGDVSDNHGEEDYWIVKLVGIDCVLTAPDSVCPRSTGNVASTAESGAEYNWTIGNGTITSPSNAQSITFTAGASGPVSLKVYVKKNGYWDQCYKDIPVALANCSWTSKSPVCNNSRVFFYGPAGMDSYQWDFGDGSQGSGRNPSHTYSAPGNYTVELNTTLRGCSKSCTGTVRVLSGPECNWTSKSYVCKDENVQFTGPAGMASYQWDFGDGKGSDEQNPKHAYDTPGTYPVSLTTTFCSNSKRCKGTVKVLSEPNCDFTSNAPVYNGTPVQFNGPAGMDWYKWEFGDDTGNYSRNASHLYKAPGFYKVNLQTGRCGNKKTCMGGVLVQEPSCIWTSSSPVCNGTTVQFTGPIEMDKYNWNFGDGAGSSAKDPHHLYSAAGTYKVNLTVTKDDYSKICTGTVVVRAPDCRWTSSSPVYNGTAVQFSGPAGMDAYHWDFGDGAVSSAQGVSHRYSAPGTYTVNLKVTATDGCSKTCTGTVVVKSQPDCSWTSSSPVCNGTPVQFNGPEGMDAYQWDFGDGAVRSAQGVSHLYSNPGIYTVSLNATKGGCSNTCRGTVTVRTSAACGRAICIDWQKCLGGSAHDSAESIEQTADGGYIVAGHTSSNDGNVRDLHGPEDFWVVKLKDSGGIAWERSIGASGMDGANCIKQTANGWYVVAGYTSSSSGSPGLADYLIVDLTPQGYSTWNKRLGGSGVDQAYSILQTADGGYAVAGSTESKDGDVRGNHGFSDYWIVKLDPPSPPDPSPKLKWQKCLGGSQDDHARSILQTADGGYVVAGWTKSSDDDVQGNHGDFDCWIVKLDKSGNLVWQKCLGGSRSDGAWCINQTADGGYVVAGYTSSKDGDVSGNHGDWDYWVVKLDASGNMEWQKCLGGSGKDMARSIRQTADGGYVVAGYTSSNDGDVSGNHGMEDYWVVKLDKSGDLVWQKLLGGKDMEEASSVRQTSDGGYVVTGYTKSNDGDVSGNHGKVGTADFWVVKLREMDCTITAPDVVSSGSAGNLASTAESGAAYAWSITNGKITSSPNNQSITFTAGAAGTTTLKVVVTGNGCAKECTKDITVTAGQDCTITAPPSVCAGSKGNVASTATAKAYVWSITNGEITSASNTQSITFTAGASGTIKLNLTVTAADGSSKKCSKDITIASGPDCTISAPDSVCAGSTGNAASTATAGAAYAWSITNGEITSASDNQITFTAGAAGTTRLEVKVTAEGCSKNCTKDIIVTAGPDCTISAPSSVCAGSTGNAASTATAGAAYAWSITNGEITSSSNNQSINFTAEASGTIKLNLTVTAADGSSKKCSKDIPITQGPECTISAPDSVCAGSKGNVASTATAKAYVWSITNGEITSASNTQSINFTAGAWGTIKLSVTVTADGCSKKCSKDITVTAAPDCSWSSNAPVCNGTSVQFTGPAGMVSYYWEFGDGKNSSAKDPSHFYLSPGTYAVVLTVTNNSCSTTCGGKGVEVKPMPDCTISAPGSICAGATGHASTAASGAAYAWSITNCEITSASNAQSIDFTAGAAGNTTLKVVVTGKGCAKECSKDITVTSGPDCTISAPNAVCAGSTGNAASTATTGAAYAWSITNGEITSASNAQSITFTAGASGTTRLEVKVTTSNGCSNSCTKDISITQGPDCTISAPNAVCAGSTGNASTAASGAAYAWSITNGEITSASNAQSITFTAGAAGTARLEVKVTAEGCSKNCTKDIIVTAGPDCTISAPNAVCAGSTGNAASTAASGAAYAWSITNGEITEGDGSQAIKFTAGLSGTTTLTVKVTAKSGCNSTCTIGIPINEMPVCTITAPPSVCGGSTGNEASTESTDGATYEWSITNGKITEGDGSQAIKFTAGLSGTTTLTVKVTAKSGCNSSCTKGVPINEMPVCTISAPSSVCAGSTGNAASTASAEAYAWSITNGQITSATNAQSITFTAGSSGTTRLEVTVTAGGCSKNCAKDITVTAGPDCSWTSNSPVNNGTEVKFTGPAGMGAYQWDFGDGSGSTDQSPSHKYSKAGSYNVSLTVAKGGCSRTCAGSVVVKSQCGDCWCSNSPVCIGTAVVFDAISGMDSYVWSFGDGTRGYEEDPSHFYSAPGKYLVVLSIEKDNIFRSCPGYVVVKPLNECGTTSQAPAPEGAAAQLAAPSGISSNPGGIGGGQVSSRENRIRIYPG